MAPKASPQGGGHRGLRQGRRCAAWPWGASSILHSFPHSHHSGHSAGHCVASPATGNASRTIPLCCTLTAPAIFSPTQTPQSLHPLHREGASWVTVGCTNTSSLESFLLRKPYPFLTVNILETFPALLLRCPPTGAADVDGARLGVRRAEAGRRGREVSASQLTYAAGARRGAGRGAGRGGGRTRAASLLAV